MRSVFNNYPILTWICPSKVFLHFPRVCSLWFRRRPFLPSLQEYWSTPWVAVFYSLKDILFLITILIFQFLQHWAPMASSRVVFPPFCLPLLHHASSKGPPPPSAHQFLVVFFFIKGCPRALSHGLCWAQWLFAPVIAPTVLANLPFFLWPTETLCLQFNIRGSTRSS